MVLGVNLICNLAVNSIWKVYLEVNWMGTVFGKLTGFGN